MANPNVINLTKDTWVKVATNVFTGVIHKMLNSPSGYIQTYRLTGESAPSDTSEGIICFVNDLPEEIKSSVGIDVYVYAKKNDGKVRVDVW